MIFVNCFFINDIDVYITCRKRSQVFLNHRNNIAFYAVKWRCGKVMMCFYHKIYLLAVTIAKLRLNKFCFFLQSVVLINCCFGSGLEDRRVGFLFHFYFCGLIHQFDIHKCSAVVVCIHLFKMLSQINSAERLKITLPVNY